MNLMSDLLNLINSLIFYIILILIVAYIISCVAVFLILTNNVFFFRKTEPILPFRTEKKQFRNSENNTLTYWISKQSSHRKWVVLLHYYGGSSESMINRAKIYLKNGFSLLLVDARSHGSSSLSKRSTAYFYALDALEIIDHEGIKNFTIHGVSLGGYATLIVAKIVNDTSMSINVNAIVIEAISKDLANILWYLLSYSPFPNFLFSWIPKLIYYHWREFDWEGHDPQIILKDMYHIPAMLIHGEYDRLYNAETHFRVLESIIHSQFHHKNSRTWLVAGSEHLGMEFDPQYSNRLTEFLIANKT